MSGYAFSLNETDLEALPSGALWWPDRRLLCVSDLHLGKSERIARRGGTLLPPYDTTETLSRLRSEIDAKDPAEVICLGDSFDDVNAEYAMTAGDQRLVLAMLAGRRWIWIAGNHDPGPVRMGGTWIAEYDVGPLLFRHIAKDDAQRGEVSGHFHPKARVPGHRSRPCFLVDTRRVILPAFGAYTGGLSIQDPAVRGLVSGGRALLTGRQIIAIPA